jgi:TIR domain
MGRIEKTVFVSYRRRDEGWALAVFHDLTKQGYDVFIDYDGIASGNFETAILENIRARAHFLVLLTPTALELSNEQTDWMRREIEAALDSQRNIVPLMLAGFKFETPAAEGQLTGKLTALRRYNGLPIPEGYFPQAMERLRTRFLNVPVDAELHPASDSAQQVAKEQKDKATAALEEPQPQPFQQTRAPPTPPRQPSASDTEFNIANRDVEKALQDLASHPLTADIIPEMQGWADLIRTAIAESKVAAAAGLYPTNRDKVFAKRRQLGEYARLARFVGSTSVEMTQNFRRLGRRLDVVSAVLLVMLGESLASAFASGSYLLQVPLLEMQHRRDTVIFALRNFAGGAQQAYGPDDWPRGIDVYRRLYSWLEHQGQGDLRSLLVENEIARTMDALITRAQNGTAEGLRALGVTAQIDIEPFRRMAIVAPGALADEHGRFDRSPPLEAYLQALELFAEAFTLKPAGGLRLLRIARPPILYYGLYRISQLEQDSALFELVAVRGTLAMIFDGLFPSNVARGSQPQMLLDMLLLELDRGIDLLALSSDAVEVGPNERRAYALWAIIEVILGVLTGQYLSSPAVSLPHWWPQQSPTLPLPGPIADRTNGGDQHFANDLASINSDFVNAANLVPGFGWALRRYQDIRLTSPLRHEEMRKSAIEELRVQMTLEDQWENLVRTMVIWTGDQYMIFELLRQVIEQAAYDVLGGQPLPRR